MQIALKSIRPKQLQLFKTIDSFSTDASRVLVSGPNGVGKSTLLRGIAGIENNIRGSISVDSKVIPWVSRSSLANLATSDLTLPSITVESLVRYLGTLSADASQVENWMRSLGLMRFARHRCDQLSSGSAQKLRIIASIARNPKLLLLDEPLEHLDHDSKLKVIELINGYNSTVWIVDHTRSFIINEELKLEF